MGHKDCGQGRLNGLILCALLSLHNTQHQKWLGKLLSIIGRGKQREVSIFNINFTSVEVPHQIVVDHQANLEPAMETVVDQEISIELRDMVREAKIQTNLLQQEGKK